MPKVNFYIIEAASNTKSLHFACQLVEKLYQENRQISIYTDSLTDTERLDALLWTYRDDSFIPHEITNDTTIMAGVTNPNKPDPNTLLNISRTLPANYLNYHDIIEIVFPDPVVQQLARDRYKQYRDQGCELTTHKIQASEL
jgi:DNA polymerase-3 subunit chi